MAEERMMAGIHNFLAPDEHTAVAVAKALTRLGFARVAVHAPDEGRTTVSRPPWKVAALDEGPYPDDPVGRHTLAVVARIAGAYAQKQGGRPSGGSLCTPEGFSNEETGARHVFTAEHSPQDLPT